MAKYLLQKFSCKKAKCGCKIECFSIMEIDSSPEKRFPHFPSFSWQKEIEFNLFRYLRSRRSMTGLDLLMKEIKFDKKISIR